MGCSPKIIRSYTSREAIDTIQSRSIALRTIKGLAWVNIQASDLTHENRTITATIVIDRTNAYPKMRVEALDPLGISHLLILITPSKKDSSKLELTVIDFDDQSTSRFLGKWHNIPLEALPHLLVGVPPVPTDGRISSASHDGFDWKYGNLLTHYLMDWIPPKPDLVLRSIRVEAEKQLQYEVKYTKFQFEKGLQLPEEILVSAELENQFKMRIVWRERTINERVAPGIFK